VKRELACRGYVRYVDDLLLFADDKAMLARWRAEIVHRLARLRLTIHAGAHPRSVTEGISFLGFIVFPERRRLKRRKSVHFQGRLRRLLREWKAGEIPLSSVTASVQGWVNHVRYGNTVGLRKALFAGRDRPSGRRHDVARARPLAQERRGLPRDPVVLPVVARPAPHRAVLHVEEDPVDRP